MKTKAAEPTGVAKRQKTFYINKDLDTVIEGYARTTGTTFTKIVTAALISYLGQPMSRYDTNAMARAVDLDKGRITLAEAIIACLEAFTSAFPKHRSKKPPSEMSFEEMALNFFHHSCEQALDDLHKAIAKKTDQNSAIVAALTRRPSDEETLKGILAQFLVKSAEKS
ncbi:MAG: hypothetical protein HY763_02195 [Planctomycetes bacterium]|nr:hypothetical protein [Planctomycetota bacterium]